MIDERPQWAIDAEKAQMERAQMNDYQRGTVDAHENLLPRIIELVEALKEANKFVWRPGVTDNPAFREGFTDEQWWSQQSEDSLDSIQDWGRDKDGKPILITYREARRVAQMIDYSLGKVTGIIDAGSAIASPHKHGDETCTMKHMTDFPRWHWPAFTAGVFWGQKGMQEFLTKQDGETNNEQAFDTRETS